MKRRSNNNPKDTPKIRSFLLRGFNGGRSSGNQFSTTISHQTKDMGKVKRVKFTDPETEHPPSRRPDASPIQHKAAQAPRSNAPKTSEYAFFKKLKKDAGISYSYPLHKEDNQPKDFKSNDCTKEITNMSKHSCEDLRSSSLVEKVGPINYNLFLSSLGGALKNSGSQYSDVEVFSTKRQKLRQWVADISLPQIDKHSSKGFDLVSVLLSRLFPEGNENNHCRDKKSRQKETDTKYMSLAIPESDIYINEPNWTRRDLKEAEHGPYLDDFSSEYWSNRSRETILPKWDAIGSEETDTKYMSLAIPESNIYINEPNWTRRDLKEAEHGPYLHDFSSEYWSNRSREIILPKWDAIGSDSPSTSYATKTQFQHESRKPDCNLGGGRTASLINESDPFFCFPFENYGSHTSSHLKELVEFQDINESALGRDPSALLLSWDFENVKDGLDLSITTHNAEMILNSTLATSWDNHQQNLDNRFSATGLYSSSFFSNYPPKFTSLPHFCSADLQALDFGRHLLKEKYLVAEPDHFPLTLSCAPKYLNLVEDCDTDNTCEVGSVFLSPQNHHWFISKVFSEKHRTGLEALFFPGLNIDLGWKCLSMIDSFGEHNSSTCHVFQSPQKEDTCSYLLTEEEQESCLYSLNHRKTITHFAEDPCNNHNWSSINFQTFLNKEMARPLQLNNSSWGRSEEEICYDDNDDERKYI